MTTLLITLSKFLFFEAEIACKASTFEPLSSDSNQNDNTTHDASRGIKRKSQDYRSQQKGKVGLTEKVYTTAVGGADEQPEAKRSKEEFNCGYCDKNIHSVVDCQEFNNLNLSKRWNWARKKKCFRCLVSVKHRQNRCRESGCTIDDCKGTTRQ